MRKICTGFITCQFVLAMLSGSTAQWQHTNGLNDVRINALSANGTYLFAGAADSGVFRSDDSGASWLRVNTGLTNLNIQALAIRGTYLFAGTRDSGVFRSGDNGVSWFGVNTGISSMTIQAFAANDTFLFVGTNGGGVCRSYDNGTQWLAVNTGLIFNNIYAFAVSSIYIFAGTWGGSAFRSDDNGMNWDLVTNGFADPRENIIPYAFAVVDTFIFAGTGGAGVFRAKDSAGVWFPMNMDLPDSAFVTALAESKDTLYAATGSGVFRTPDNGENWFPVNEGLTDTVVYSFVVNRGNLFAGTINGVWKFPLTDPVTNLAEKNGHLVTAGSNTRTITLKCSSPLTPHTTFNYATGYGKKGIISVYSPSGKMLFSKDIYGDGALVWNTSNRSSGVYFARLSAGATYVTLKMVLPK